MKKSKRLLSLVFAVMMMVSLFAITSKAAGETATVTIKTSSQKVTAGDEITVTVNVATNYYATSMRWPILFSNSFFEYVEGSLEATEALTNIGGSATKNENPSSTAYTSSCTSENHTALLVQWSGASASGMAPFNNPDGVDCFTFKLKVKDTVVIGDEGEILVPSDSTLFYNQMLTDTEEPFTFDKVVQCKDLTYNLVPATVKVAKHELLAVEGTSTVIDSEKNIIRGVDENVTDNLEEYIYATDGASVVLTPAVDGRMGTGTKVELVVDGTVLESYTLIIAGDINGDALVDVTDYICLDLAEAYAMNLSSAQLLAGDLTANGSCDASDKIALDSYLVFAGEIDQVNGVFTAN